MRAAHLREAEITAGAGHICRRGRRRPRSTGFCRTSSPPSCTCRPEPCAWLCGIADYGHSSRPHTASPTGGSTRGCRSRSSRGCSTCRCSRRPPDNSRCRTPGPRRSTSPRACRRSAADSSSARRCRRHIPGGRGNRSRRRSTHREECRLRSSSAGSTAIRTVGCRRTGTGRRFRCRCSPGCSDSTTRSGHQTGRSSDSSRRPNNMLLHEGTPRCGRRRRRTRRCSCRSAAIPVDRSCRRASHRRAAAGGPAAYNMPAAGVGGSRPARRSEWSHRASIALLD